jgi:hypothetical protein
MELQVDTFPKNQIKPRQLEMKSKEGQNSKLMVEIRTMVKRAYHRSLTVTPVQVRD